MNKCILVYLCFLFCMFGCADDLSSDKKKEFANFSDDPKLKQMAKALSMIQDDIGVAGRRYRHFHIVTSIEDRERVTANFVSLVNDPLLDVISIGCDRHIDRCFGVFEAALGAVEVELYREKIFLVPGEIKHKFNGVKANVSMQAYD